MRIAVITALLILTSPLVARAGDEPAPALEASRQGFHVGVGVGPHAIALLRGGEPRFGVAVRLIAHVGLSPELELRTGLSADAAGSVTSFMSLRAPLVLRANFKDVYSIALGAVAGMMTDTSHVAVVAGPTWSIIWWRARASPSLAPATRATAVPRAHGRPRSLRSAAL